MKPSKEELERLSKLKIPIGLDNEIDECIKEMRILIQSRRTCEMIGGITWRNFIKDFESISLKYHKLLWEAGILENLKP